MTEYSRVVRTFWSGPTGRVLRARGRDVQFLALYVFTGPSVHQSGLYYVALPTMCHEAGFTIDLLRATLAVLAEVGFAFYDEEQELMWVPEMAVYQIAETLKMEDNRQKGVVAWLRQFREHRFGLEFHEKYREAYSLPSEGFKRPLRRPSQGASKGSKPPSEAIPDQNRTEHSTTEQTSSGAVAPAQGDEPKARGWTAEACDDWIAKFGGSAPGGEIGKWLKPVVDKHGWPLIRPAWQRYLAEKDPEFAKPKDFAEKPGPWLNAVTRGNTAALARAGPQGRQPSTAGEKSVAAAERYLDRRRGSEGGG